MAGQAAYYSMAGHAAYTPLLKITFSLCRCHKCTKGTKGNPKVREITIEQRGEDVQIWDETFNRFGLFVTEWKSFFEKEKEIKHLLENGLSNRPQGQGNVIIHLALKKVFSLKALALSAAVRHQFTQMDQRFFFSGLHRVKKLFHYLTEDTIKWFVENDLDLLDETVDIFFGCPVFALVAIKENDYMLNVYSGLELRAGYKGRDGISFTKHEIEKIMTFKNIFFF